MVRVDINVPEHVPPGTLEELKRREAGQARCLADAGTLKRLWRDPSRWANWGLWEAADENALLRALDTLPLRPYMSITIHRVTEHPSDPGAAFESRRSGEEP